MDEVIFVKFVLLRNRANRQIFDRAILQKPSEIIRNRRTDILICYFTYESLPIDYEGDGYSPQPYPI